MEDSSFTWSSLDSSKELNPGKELVARASRYATVLDERNSQLRALSYYAALAEYKERRRLAQRIEDRIGQKLASCEIRLGIMAKSGHSPAGLLAEMRSLIREMLQETRQLNSEFNPHVFYELGLTAAIGELVFQTEKDNPVKCHFKSDPRLRVLDEDIALLLLQSVRELVSNCLKHSGASNISVCLSMTEDYVEIAVEDDGNGFDQQRLSVPIGRQIGLLGIRERLTFINGCLDIKSILGLGTQATIRVPLRYAEPLEPGEGPAID